MNDDRQVGPVESQGIDPRDIRRSAELVKEEFGDAWVPSIRVLGVMAKARAEARLDYITQHKKLVSACREYFAAELGSGAEGDAEIVLHKLLELEP